MTINLPSYNNQNNHTLAEENTSLVWENETVSYGLEITNTTSSNEQPLGTISNESLFDESVDTSQFGTEDSYSELVFIDSAVPDSQTLIDNISGATDVVLLDEEEDEIVQISEHLSDYQQLDAVHIVSLGESGQLSFANTELNTDTLAQYDNLLHSWRNSLDEKADLVLYGCDVALGQNGNSFVRQLSQTTGADVLASVDRTGIEGDWVLEKASGKIETGSIFTDSIATAYQYTLDEGDFGITPDTGVDFGDDVNDTGVDFREVDADDLVVLPEVDIDNDGKDFDYGELESGDIAELDFKNVPAEDLQILTTEEGLSFTEFKAEDLAELDINNIPAENIKIMQNAGLDLTSYNTETVADVELGVVATVGYVNEDIFEINSLSEDTTFGSLSATVVANANLYNYKNESLNLDDGFSLSETQQLDFNDYKALDFAFDGDEIFDSSYYLENNPDVAEDENRINPFTQYFISGAYAPEFRDPSTYFDTSYYLENNPDVAEDENRINPLFQYFNSGAKAPEFRDPDPAFDTSFYLKENPVVAESGINPLFHYFNSGADEGRYANSVFKNLEEIGEALVTSLDIDGEDFDDFKETALSLIETRQQDTEVNTAGVALPIIPILVKIGEVILATYITKKAIDTSDDIRELLQQSNSFDNDNVSGSSNVFVFPNDNRLTQGEILTFPEGEFDVDFGSEPYDLGEPIGFNDNTFFPKGDGFLDDILNGRFESPDEDEVTFSLFDAAGKAGNDIGDIREQAVADLLGVEIVKDSNGQDITVFEPGASASVSIDIFGANGELILVGGPNKVTDFGKLGGILRNLKLIADARGVKAQHYFTDNTDEAVIKFTEKRLGAENVFTFPEVSP